MTHKDLCKKVEDFAIICAMRLPYEVTVKGISLSYSLTRHNPVLEVRIDTSPEYIERTKSVMSDFLQKTLMKYCPKEILEEYPIVVVPINNSKEKIKMYIPVVKEIIHRKTKKGELFTVMWGDDTTTTVKLKEGESSDEYSAFLYALGKKLFEDKGKARAFIKEKKKVFEDRIECKRAEKERKLKAKQLQKEMESSDVADISDLVYQDMFVAPALISRSIFRKNKDSN